jgi:hypothetical protein
MLMKIWSANIAIEMDVVTLLVNEKAEFPQSRDSCNSRIITVRRTHTAVAWLMDLLLTHHGLLKW